MRRGGRATNRLRSRRPQPGETVAHLSREIAPFRGSGFRVAGQSAALRRAARPPAIAAASIRLASSTNARGHPPVSQMMRRAVSGSTRVSTLAESSSRAASSGSPSIGKVGSPSNTPPTWDKSRTPNNNATRSASSRRATKLKASSDSRSIHCASSMTQKRPRSDPRSARRFRQPRPTRKRSAGMAEVNPKAASRAHRCGSGSCSNRGINGLMRR